MKRVCLWAVDSALVEHCNNNVHLDGQFCDKHVNNGEVDAEVIVNSKIESSDGSSSVRSCNSSSSLSSPVSEEWAAGEDGLLGALSSGAEGSIGVSMGVGVGVIPTGVSACMMNADCKASGGNNSTKSSGYCSGAEANTNLGSTSTGSGKNDSSVQSSSQSMYDNRKHTCVDKTMTTLFIANKTSSFINQYMATYILQNSGWVSGQLQFGLSSPTCFAVQNSATELYFKIAT